MYVLMVKTKGVYIHRLHSTSLLVCSPSVLISKITIEHQSPIRWQQDVSRITVLLCRETTGDSPREVAEMWASNLYFVWGNPNTTLRKMIQDVVTSIRSDCSKRFFSSSTHLTKHQLRSLDAAWHTVYPKKYAHGFVVLCFVVVMQSFIMNSHEVFIHIHQGCFAGTGAIVRLPQCQWSKPDGYGKISQCITTTKHSKAKTVCIFLGIYCSINEIVPHAKIYIFVHYALVTMRLKIPTPICWVYIYSNLLIHEWELNNDINMHFLSNMYLF